MRDGRGWRALQLEEVDSLPWADTELEWRPLREALGARIVGMAGFSAGRAEQELVEGHTEDNGGRGHEEVYIVLDGRARFTLDGEELDAPAGTFVRVDPAVHRRAVAVRPGTSVLALGGPPSFEPSASEWIERARPHIRPTEAPVHSLGLPAQPRIRPVISRRNYSCRRALRRCSLPFLA